MMRRMRTCLRQLQQVFKNCGSMCVRCILILVNMVAWRFMRASHKELTLCWRVGITEPITKDFVRNLNKTKYMYVISHLTLQHTFLIINAMWNFAYMYTSLCNIISNFKSKKEPMNCLWLSIEDEYVPSVLSFVNNCTWCVFYNAYLELLRIKNWELTFEV